MNRPCVYNVKPISTCRHRPPPLICGLDGYNYMSPKSTTYGRSINLSQTMWIDSESPTFGASASKGYPGSNLTAFKHACISIKGDDLIFFADTKAKSYSHSRTDIILVQEISAINNGICIGRSYILVGPFLLRAA